MKRYRVKHHKTLVDFGVFEFVTEVHDGENIVYENQVYYVTEVCHVINSTKTEEKTILYINEVKSV